MVLTSCPDHQNRLIFCNFSENPKIMVSSSRVRRAPVIQAVYDENDRLVGVF